MMKNIPKVAVITRTKDRGLLLERAIQSVQNQTMGDFVQVILNDGGDREIVDDLVKKHADLINGRVKVIHNDSQTGHAAALNKAIGAIDSEYIAVHDDDDSWDEAFLRLTTEFLDEKKVQGVIAVVDIVDEKIENGKIIKIKQGRGVEPVRGVVSLYDQCLVNYATPITFVYRRSAYDAIGGYSQDFEVAEDWDFTLRFLMKYDIHSLITDEALSFYHHRIDSTGTELNSIFVDGGARFDLHINKVANYHLRKEIETGSLGLGYMIASVRHNRNALMVQNDTLNGRINDSVKQELHYIADGIKEHVDRRAEALTHTVEDNSFKHAIAKRFKNSD